MSLGVTAYKLLLITFLLTVTSIINYQIDDKIPVRLTLYVIQGESFEGIDDGEKSGILVCGQTGGRTDGHDEANSGFSQFCERA